MSDYTLMSSDGIEANLCLRLERIRLERDITQADLAREAGISTRTIRRLEKGDGTSLATFIRVLKALRLEGRLEELLPKQNVQPIQRVGFAKPTRERASGKRKNSGGNAPWTWGDE